MHSSIRRTSYGQSTIYASNIMRHQVKQFYFYIFRHFVHMQWRHDIRFALWCPPMVCVGTMLHYYVWNSTFVSCLFGHTHMKYYYYRLYCFFLIFFVSFSSFNFIFYRLLLFNLDVAFLVPSIHDKEFVYIRNPFRGELSFNIFILIWMVNGQSNTFYNVVWSAYHIRIVYTVYTDRNDSDSDTEAPNSQFTPNTHHHTHLVKYNKTETNATNDMEFCDSGTVCGSLSVVKLYIVNIMNKYQK